MEGKGRRGFCSTSPPGGNQVGGLPPVVSRDKEAHAPRCRGGLSKLLVLGGFGWIRLQFGGYSGVAAVGFKLGSFSYELVSAIPGHSTAEALSRHDLVRSGPGIGRKYISSCPKIL